MAGGPSGHLREVVGPRACPSSGRLVRRAFHGCPLNWGSLATVRSRSVRRAGLGIAAVVHSRLLGTPGCQVRVSRLAKGSRQVLCLSHRCCTLFGVVFVACIALGALGGHKTVGMGSTPRLVTTGAQTHSAWSTMVAFVSGAFASGIGCLASFGAPGQKQCGSAAQPFAWQASRPRFSRQYGTPRIPSRGRGPWRCATPCICVASLVSRSPS